MKKNNVKAFISIFKIKAAEYLQYRAAAAATSTTAIFWAIIEITIYSVFYKYAENKNAGLSAGLSLKQIATYMWLSQIMYSLQSFSIDDEIRTKIVNGDVGVELVRPIPLYLFWFSKTAASRISLFVLRGVCVLLAGFLMPGIYKMSLPISISRFLLFLISIVSAFLLCNAYAMLICAIRMSVPWGDAPTYMLMLISGVLSGGYLPLQLWPDFMQKFLYMQPFAGYCDIPLRIYLGTFDISGALYALIIQCIWIIIFIFLGNMLLNKNIKTIVVQGG